MMGRCLRAVRAWMWLPVASALLATIVPALAQQGRMTDLPPAVTVDDRGQPLALPVPPQRVVSLLPSLTETVCALGACARLVGVDRFSDWPAASLQSLPRVGGGLDPNIEAIVALRPDVVLLSNASRIVARLEALGLRTVVLEPQDFPDVQRALQAVAVVLGLPVLTADQEWQRIQAGIDAAAASIPASVRGARVYFEVNRGPYVAAPSSFIGQLLTRLQVDNVVPDGLGPFPLLNSEFVLRAQPDVILLGSHSAQVAHSYPGWGRLAAVQQQRVCTFDEAQGSAIVRPGPRMDVAARTLAQCLADKGGRHGR